jgi:hypothetical protein
LKPQSLYFQEKILQYPLDRRLVGLRTVLNAAKKKTNLLSLQGIKPCFLEHRARSIVTISNKVPCVGFEVFTAVTMKNAIFWDVAPCRSCEMYRRSSETSVNFTGSRRSHIPEDGILQDILAHPDS